MINKKVLIIEDEKDLREVLNDKFSMEGCKVVTAEDGEKGLVCALSEKPDIILLDIIMPKLNGMEMLAKLREDKWGKDVPVIILTNLSASEEFIVNGLVLHKPTFFLVKSDWKLEDVVEKVRGVLMA
jgi:DNA-binding response OmpR family regulator